MPTTMLVSITYLFFGRNLVCLANCGDAVRNNKVWSTIILCSYFSYNILPKLLVETFCKLQIWNTSNFHGAIYDNRAQLQGMFWSRIHERQFRWGFWAYNFKFQTTFALGGGGIRIPDIFIRIWIRIRILGSVHWITELEPYSTYIYISLQR